MRNRSENKVEIVFIRHGLTLTATEAYCIIDADTGLVLAQQNMNEELHPASITKVMTIV